MTLGDMADGVMKVASAILDVRDLRVRQKQIVKLVGKARRCLVDHHLEREHDPCVHGVLDEIERLASQ